MSEVNRRVSIVLVGQVWSDIEEGWVSQLHMVRLVSLGEGGRELGEVELGWVTVRLVEVEMSGSK